MSYVELNVMSYKCHPELAVKSGVMLTVTSSKLFIFSSGTQMNENGSNIKEGFQEQKENYVVRNQPSLSLTSSAIALVLSRVEKPTTGGGGGGHKTH
jgi:hypothetical protein